MKDRKNWWRKLSVAFALLILITATLFNADTALARPAAATCASHYTVKSGDTLSKIAAAYNVTLTALADANNLKAPYTIYIGNSLCVPKSSTSSSSPTKTPASSSSSDFTATKKSEKLTIKVENFSKNAGYFVRVQPIDGSRNWEKVGSLSTDKYGDGEVTITLTSNTLKKVSQLNVCLKDISDDDTICTVTGSTTTTSSGNSSSSSTTGDFTATVKKDILTIQVDNFPKNSGYYVRVKPTNSSLGWVKIGELSTDKYGDGKETITLTSNTLKKASQLSVCLKDTGNDNLRCTTTGSTSSSSSSSTTPVSFTARVQGNQLFIQSKNATENEGYIVRVNKSANQYTGQWYRIGTVTADANGKINKAVRLSGDFQKAAVLHICLKDASTDETFCVTIKP